MEREIIIKQGFWTQRDYHLVIITYYCPWVLLIVQDTISCSHILPFLKKAMYYSVRGNI